MTRKKKILVVDDEPDILTTTRYLLEDAGYEVFTADSGEDGLSKMKEVKPDLIALDLILPGQDGFQIAQKIKALNEYKHIPVIVLSCKKDDLDKYVAARSGVVEYIEKPIDPEQLLYHIKDILSS